MYRFKIEKFHQETNEKFEVTTHESEDGRNIGGVQLSDVLHLQLVSLGSVMFVLHGIRYQVTVEDSHG